MSDGYRDLNLNPTGGKPQLQATAGSDFGNPIWCC